MQTHMSKNSRGWKAETLIELDAGRVLTIGTARSLNYSAALVTQAFVETPDAAGQLRHAVLYEGAAVDFNRAVLVSAPPRHSERAVRAQHDLALQKLQAIKTLIERHYAAA